jgi:rhodanese-related sulfurtransferase
MKGDDPMTDKQIETIAPGDLDALRTNEHAVDLIDVRTPAEFREVHVTFARNVPLGDLLPAVAAGSHNGSADGPVYLICRSGSRARAACEKLIQAGHRNVVAVEGGTDACVQAGLPVERGPKAVTLERQVRIAAGSLVLLGVILAWLVHPYLIGISAFVGAGLIFAGLTDFCGMGILLARMPWNRGDAQPACPKS